MDFVYNGSFLFPNHFPILYHTTYLGYTCLSYIRLLGISVYAVRQLKEIAVYSCTWMEDVMQEQGMTLILHVWQDTGMSRWCDMRPVAFGGSWDMLE
jgi:hypothetical protein